MKQGLPIAIALLSGAILASFLLDDPGKLTISLHGTVIEMSLPIAVLLFIALYALIRLTSRWFARSGRATKSIR